MGWASQPVRAFLAGLGNKGIRGELLVRGRQVGPNKTGAKGSSRFRLADESRS
jgi:hypothetical protein